MTDEELTALADDWLSLHGNTAGRNLAVGYLAFFAEVAALKAQLDGQQREIVAIRCTLEHKQRQIVAIRRNMPVQVR